MTDAPPAVPTTPRWLVLLWTGGPALLAVAVGVTGAVTGDDWWLLLGLVAAAALASRERAPIVAWLASLAVPLAAAAAVRPAIAPALVLPVLPLAAVAAGAPVRRSLAAAVATLAVLGISVASLPGPASAGVNVALGLLCVALVATGWLIGYALLTRRRHGVALEERARWLEGRRVADAAVAAQRERHAIARELHDLVSHNVSVMTLQAAAASAMLEVDARRARQPIAAIESTGRSAMAELRAMLAALRDAEGAERRAQPRLTDLDALAAPLRAAGLAVDLDVEANIETLPAAVDLTAYRIVQEALTNALRHAEATRVAVRLTRDAAALTVEVCDDGVGLSAPPGNGLVGMRERAGLLHGTLDVESGAAGGTTVRARLGLPTVASAR